MNKVKIPKIAVLRKAIQDIEECDPVYKHNGDFNGITIKHVSIDKDYDDIKDYVVSYEATVHFFDHKETYYDCWMDLERIMNFLNIPLS